MPSSAQIDQALAAALLREGMLNAGALRRAEEHRGEGVSLEEALLELGLCSERDVLHCLAKQWRFQYLTHERAEQLRVQEPLLDRVPVRFAEAHWLLPFRIDENEILWILTVAPVEEAVLLRLMELTRARAVSRLLARRATVRAAIRKHYYRDPAAFQHAPGAPALDLDPQAEPAPAPNDPFDRSDLYSVSETLRCPSCHAPASIRHFQCSNCGLLLNPDAGSDPSETGPTENSVVRAMLSGGAPPPAPVETSDERPTVRAEMPLERSVVPTLVAGLDVVEKPLNEFEAFVASFIDGETNVVELARAAKLSEVETNAILRSLAERKIVDLQKRPAIKSHVAAALAEVRRAGDAPDSSTPTPPPPPVDDRTQSVLQQAVSLERAGRTEDAIRVLKAGITQLRKPAPLLNRLALVILDQRRDARGAEELLKKAVELDPSNEVYQRNLYKVISLAAVRALELEKKKR